MEIDELNWNEYDDLIKQEENEICLLTELNNEINIIENKFLKNLPDQKDLFLLIKNSNLFSSFSFLVSFLLSFENKEKNIKKNDIKNENIIKITKRKKKLSKNEENFEVNDDNLLSKNDENIIKNDEKLTKLEENEKIIEFLTNLSQNLDKISNNNFSDILSNSTVKNDLKELNQCLEQLKEASSLIYFDEKIEENKELFEEDSDEENKFEDSSFIRDIRKINEEEKDFSKFSSLFYSFVPYGRSYDEIVEEMFYLEKLEYNNNLIKEKIEKKSYFSSSSFSSSISSSNLNLLINWKNLFHYDSYSYNENYDGFYRNILKDKLIDIKKKKYNPTLPTASIKLKKNDRKKNNNPSLISPPCPIHHHHPAAWGLNISSYSQAIYKKNDKPFEIIHPASLSQVSMFKNREEGKNEIKKETEEGKSDNIINNRKEANSKKFNMKKLNQINSSNYYYPTLSEEFFDKKIIFINNVDQEINNNGINTLNLSNLPSSASLSATLTTSSTSLHSPSNFKLSELNCSSDSSSLRSLTPSPLSNPSPAKTSHNFSSISPVPTTSFTPQPSNSILPPFSTISQVISSDSTIHNPPSLSSSKCFRSSSSLNLSQSSSFEQLDFEMSILKNILINFLYKIKKIIKNLLIIKKNYLEIKNLQNKKFNILKNFENLYFFYSKLGKVEKKKFNFQFYSPTSNSSSTPVSSNISNIISSSIPSLSSTTLPSPCTNSKIPSSIPSLINSSPNSKSILNNLPLSPCKRSYSDIISSSLDTYDEDFDEMDEKKRNSIQAASLALSYLPPHLLKMKKEFFNNDKLYYFSFPNNNSQSTSATFSSIFPSLTDSKFLPKEELCHNSSSNISAPNTEPFSFKLKENLFSPQLNIIYNNPSSNKLIKVKRNNEIYQATVLSFNPLPPSPPRFVKILNTQENKKKICWIPIENCIFE